MDKQAPAWQDFVEHVELSDVGLRRANNQDAFGWQMAGNDEQWRARGHLFMVADGMGAHAAGELASKIAVDTITLNYFKNPDHAAPEALRKSVQTANTRIHATGEDNIDFKGMGTTCSCLLVLPAGAVVSQVGDSRVYRLRGNRLEQLSRDHSLVWEMMANQRLSEEDLPSHIPKNIITRSLGPSADVQVDLEGPFPLAVGDTFLICSDGLSGQVGDEEIGVILGLLPPTEAVRVLVDLANLRGGPDNITVIVVRVRYVDHVGLGSGSGAAASGASGAVGWVGLGAFAALAAALAVMGNTTWAIGAGVLAALAGMLAVGKRFSDPPSGPGVNPAVSLGTGPHRSYICTPTAEMLERFRRLVEPVCQTAHEQSWEIDWESFGAQERAASQAESQQQPAVAIREYLRGIISLMRNVRDQRNRQTDP